MGIPDNSRSMVWRGSLILKTADINLKRENDRQLLSEANNFWEPLLAPNI